MLSDAVTLILSCSARAGGNSDFASSALHGHALKAGKRHTTMVRLRDLRIKHCLSCAICQVSDQPCPSSFGDDSSFLFQSILRADRVVIVSPIYFYHLPGLLKIFIDRGQFYYGLHEQGKAGLTERPWRKFHPVLVCAREKGERIFAGSLLTLDLFMRPFHFQSAEPLLLRGLDRSSALAGDRVSLNMLDNYARNMFVESHEPDIS